MSKRLFKKAAVIGLGQIGASIAAHLTHSRLVDEVLAYNRSENARKFALKKKWVDHTSSDLASIVKEADLIFLCLPVYLIESTLKQIKPWLKKDALVTDVGSSKKEIVAYAKKLKVKQFVGSHPIAGNEIAGIHGAREDLFKDRWWFLTLEKHPKKAKLKKLLQSFGAKVAESSASEHDRIFSLVSHLPHVVAYSLVSVVLANKQGDYIRYSAGGFRDFTRIASSSPEMWKDIFLSNKSEVLRATDQMIKTLEKFRTYLEDPEGKSLKKFLEKTSDIRKKL